MQREQKQLLDLRKYFANDVFEDGSCLMIKVKDPTKEGRRCFEARMFREVLIQAFFLTLKHEK